MPLRYLLKLMILKVSCFFKKTKSSKETVKAIEQAIKDGELRKGMNVILMLLFNIETWMSTSSKRLTTELM